MPSPRCLFFRTLILGFAAALLISIPCASQMPDKPESKPSADEGEVAHKIFPVAHIKEDVIAEITSGSVVAGARSTENHLAWAEKAKNGSHIVRLDGKQLGTASDDVKDIAFSADQEHLIWAAKRGSKWIIVVDGDDKTKPYGKVTSPTINANGKHFAVGACEQKRCKLLVDGEETGPDFEDISYT